MLATQGTTFEGQWQRPQSLGSNWVARSGLSDSLRAGRRSGKHRDGGERGCNCGLPGASGALLPAAGSYVHPAEHCFSLYRVIVPLEAECRRQSLVAGTSTSRLS